MPNLAGQYHYTAVWSVEDQAYVGTVLELPSVSWVADEADAALTGLRLATEAILADMAASGETPPTPQDELDAAMVEIKAKFGDALRRLGDDDQEVASRG